MILMNYRHRDVFVHKFVYTEILTKQYHLWHYFIRI